MASTSDMDVQETHSLPAIFQEGLDLFNNLGRIDEPTNSISVQSNVRKAINLLEQATRLVSLAGLFSRNETIDEIATADIQYLLLPALLGSLSLKLTSGERKDIIDVADVYFRDFLQRCNDYNLSNYMFKNKPASESSETVKSEFDKLQDMVNTRASKIQRFNEQKELRSKLEDLRKHMANEHVEEEIKRAFFLTMIKQYIYEAIDELHSIEMEKPILEHMANLNKDDKVKPKRYPPKPLKPVIITKDALQKQVYGIGYPSIPTMTVEEFYDKRVRDGIFPDPHKKPSAPSLLDTAVSGRALRDEAEDVDLEDKEESDDPEYLKKMRDRDEFKDDHRRGWGNRMNRS